MKNFTIAIAVLLVMASFTTNLTNSSSTVLSDYEGTLLESAPIMENNDGEVSVTFTVDQNVIVSSALIGASNEIFLVENGDSNSSKTVTLDLQPVDGKVKTAFNNIYEDNYDVADMNALLNVKNPDKRPKGVIIWE
ncbi:hypothetical protein [Lutimonas zeaxanthinifaciens]|uniref:hypothetical protein n=1 Tax=Lutimonas zeaxanthinifaciens TaxID=3060215 RepID=UPI00265C8FAD|nr:hypothetical protein [Lutimonas sp. YSD2104]WKK66750.1 hypothetical protein QZH61_03820 [Lutimonas sp. YSD2104]